MPGQSDEAALVEQLTLTAVDGTELAGGLFAPAEQTGLPAIFITHGTGSAWNRRVAGWFPEQLVPLGYPVLALNRRDHDDMSCAIPFEAGLEDLAIGMAALAERGHQRVVLAGHSKGTLYAPAYVAATRDQRVIALALLGAVDDNTNTLHDTLGPGRAESMLAKAREALQSQGPDATVEFETDFGLLPGTPHGFLSLFAPEAVSNPRLAMPALAELGIPMLILHSSTDTATPHRYSDNLLEMALDAGVPADLISIEDPDPARDGLAGHAFEGTEDLASRALDGWLRESLAASR